MSDLLRVTGMVLSAGPVGEYDKRLVLLTTERGKISAFAKGARRPNSPLLAGSRPFAFGSFELYEGRSSYNLRQTEIRQYFEELQKDLESVCYASYFAELADYYGREGIDARAALNLLYASFRALERRSVEPALIRRIYELKAMQQQGEYFPAPRDMVHESAAYAWNYVLSAAPDKLYSFRLSEEALRDFGRQVERQMDYYIDRKFRSLELLDIFR